MPLNLITDRWIPVRRVDGSSSVIRPDELTDLTIAFPHWPRADLNIACLEFLIGLLLLADPPADDEEWEERRNADPARLRDRLQPFAPAFNVIGDGPLFLQDLEPLVGEPIAPDMLFIDSAGGNTAKNNADLMVWRNRYPTLDLPMAAMALYTLQAHAPAGGAGNRTSMRGGGPMVTFVDPGTNSLWDLLWTNVPNGRAAKVENLPWMRRTRTSEAKGSETVPALAHPVEAFFGLPRRLRFVAEDDRIVGVIQRPYGTNYAGWLHPLTPYYRLNVGTELLPLHPRAGAFGYRNWMGVTISAPPDGKETKQLAETIVQYRNRVHPEDREGASVIVAGWSMDNMKPRDFIFSREPLLTLDADTLQKLREMIEAAETFGSSLRSALKIVVGDGTALDMLREDFFADTQSAFETIVRRLSKRDAVSDVAAEWIRAMERVAIGIFDREALTDLFDKKPEAMKPIIMARDYLRATFAGWCKPGLGIYGSLGVTPQARKKEAA